MIDALIFVVVLWLTAPVIVALMDLNHGARHWSDPKWPWE